ncbi:Mrp/NBP35 family ATP-binding protein [Caldisalinibacter kiritimatiensis]|uniref:Iron-sulfur cluster carrier protein n=1 Tax=Caldisalinibacter kiritimatiensis TaxID=1304284 RepID=R1CSW6_9FIRM|nr:Mrp/NBP35 family ATP-binding protein [Caldisalinibacter kiritimatiensis]EOD01746.1 Mrp protein [Caldisalinibacter kiritimatiensis]
MELKEKVYKALENVNDPELHKSLVELDMIEEVVLDGSEVMVNVSLTTIGCPMKAKMEEDIKREVGKLDEVTKVKVIFGEMSKEQKDKLIEKLHGKQKKAEPFKNTRVIAIGSGKGGVGKSTVTANLAVTLAEMGYKVGLIDADILGYSIPQILGIKDVKPMAIEGGFILPIERNGVKVMSMGNLVEGDQALIWRGPLLGGVLDQFMNDVYWGDLDYMLIDLPPGTGDVPLSLMQKLPKAEILIVTTPQITAANVAKRLGLMANKTNSKIIGLIENMSYFVCNNCGEKHYIFGKAEGEKLSKELNTTLLGEIPLVTGIREDSDKGVPSVIDLESEVGKVYKEIAKNLIETK